MVAAQGKAEYRTTRPIGGEQGHEERRVVLSFGFSHSVVGIGARYTRIRKPS